MNVPTLWEFALLGLATYRVFRLLAEDTILDRPRRWLLRGDLFEDDATQPPGYRATLAYFLACPFCCGFWLSLLAWIAWILDPHATLVIATPLAVSAVVGLVAANLDP